MKAFCRGMNYRRMAVVGTLAVAAFALPSAVRTARADDWQQCMAHQPDQLLAACSAVIDQGGRPDAELSRAHAIRGEWYRVRNRNDEALADYQQAEKLDPKLRTGHRAQSGKALRVFSARNCAPAAESDGRSHG
jgi:hypothetical protein